MRLSTVSASERNEAQPGPFENVTGYCNNEEVDSEVAVVCERYELAEEVERLRAALRTIATYESSSVPAKTQSGRVWNALLNVRNIASRALEQE